MAIANETCVSFCNQPKAQFGYLTTVTPVCRCLHTFGGWRYLATSRESKIHFGLPGYAHWTIAVNVTWMERGFNAGQTHCSIHTYFQPFTSYSEILVGNCNLFLPHAFNAPVGIPEKVWSFEN